MIFEVLRDPRARELVLSFLAFGVAHAEHPWRRPPTESPTNASTHPSS
jgi:hypothetical protein